MTRAHYESLLEAGVQIFEYTPGFMHGKNFVVDDQFGTVGTVNMDYRRRVPPLRGRRVAVRRALPAGHEGDLLRTQAQSERITLQRCRAHSGVRRLFRAVLRILAPLM